MSPEDARIPEQSINEGGDPASAELRDDGAGEPGDYARRQQEAHSFAQLGLAGNAPDHRGDDLPLLAADDAGASALAQKAGAANGKARP